MNTKILLIIAILAATVLSLGMLSLARMATLDAKASLLYSGSVLAVEHIKDIDATTERSRSTTFSYVISNDESKQAGYAQALKDDDATFAALTTRYQSESIAPELVPR
ncbi:MAG TPA: MCP four helix bundle domain-containing protein [Actinoplanes sp.]|nr:MCP four helix bundle domain-containing protein [Actinoplanes sp.]